MRRHTCKIIAFHSAEENCGERLLYGDFIHVTFPERCHWSITSYQGSNLQLIVHELGSDFWTWRYLKVSHTYMSLFFMRRWPQEHRIDNFVCLHQHHILT